MPLIVSFARLSKKVHTSHSALADEQNNAIVNSIIAGALMPLQAAGLSSDIDHLSFA